MKKVVLASFLACAVIASGLPFASAQDAAQAPAGGAAPAAGATSGEVKMPDAEYQVYHNAWTMPQSTQAEIEAKAAALEAYLTQYPQSAVKASILEAIMQLDSLYDGAKALNAADRLLQVDPNNLTALYVEAVLHKPAATVTDTAARQTALDAASEYARKALAATKPAATSEADWTTMQKRFYPSLYGILGNDAFNKKDTATAIDEFKKELTSVPEDQTKVPGDLLLDTFYLGEAYWESTPPDYLDCAFYAARAAAFAPAPFNAQFTTTAKYCYHKYHGDNDDQYNQLVQLASASLNPPTDLATTIKPAPTPAQIIAGILQSTPPDQLATSDKEYILQNGTPDQVSTVWNSMKGKSFQFPDVLVIASTPQQVQVAISPDAVQSKTADFTFNMTPPTPVPDLPAHPTAAEKLRHEREVKKAAADAVTIAAATAPGQTVTLSGTFDSYTPKPFMINLTDGAVILPKPTPAKAPVHHTATKR